MFDYSCKAVGLAELYCGALVFLRLEEEYRLSIGPCFLQEVVLFMRHFNLKAEKLTVNRFLLDERSSLRQMNDFSTLKIVSTERSIYITVLSCFCVQLANFLL